MKCLKATLSYFFDKGAQMVLLAVVPALLSALQGITPSDEEQAEMLRVLTNSVKNLTL